jgi:hypothetical protein
MAFEAVLRNPLALIADVICYFTYKYISQKRQFRIPPLVLHRESTELPGKCTVLASWRD